MLSICGGNEFERWSGSYLDGFFVLFPFADGAPLGGQTRQRRARQDARRHLQSGRERSNGKLSLFPRPIASISKGTPLSLCFSRSFSLIARRRIDQNAVSHRFVASLSGRNSSLSFDAGMHAAAPGRDAGPRGRDGAPRQDLR